MRNARKAFRLAAVLLAGLFLAADMALPLGVAGGMPYITIVLLSLWSPRRRSVITAAIAGTVLTVVGVFVSPPGGEVWKVVVNRALAIFAIWITAVLILARQVADRRRDEALQQREQALADMKVLHGLLPICAGCKRIRDDSGYWNTLETYIRDHSEADFSHSLCPDCLKRLYPDYKAEDE